MNRTIVGLALLAAACGGGKAEAPAAPPPDDVATAIAISLAVDANPTSTDSILAAYTMTRPGFDSLLFRIAADSSMSARYVAGRR